MRIVLTLLVALISSVTPAAAYVGPGLGLGAIGVIGGVILSVFLAIFSLVWYPVKRLLKKRGASKTNAASAAAPARDSVGAPVGEATS